MWKLFDEFERVVQHIERGVEGERTTFTNMLHLANKLVLCIHVLCCFHELYVSNGVLLEDGHWYYVESLEHILYPRRYYN